MIRKNQLFAVCHGVCFMVVMYLILLFIQKLNYQERLYDFRNISGKRILEQSLHLEKDSRSLFNFIMRSKFRWCEIVNDSNLVNLHQTYNNAIVKIDIMIEEIRGNDFDSNSSAILTTNRNKFTILKLELLVFYLNSERILGDSDEVKDSYSSGIVNAKLFEFIFSVAKINEIRLTDISAHMPFLFATLRFELTELYSFLINYFWSKVTDICILCCDSGVMSQPEYSYIKRGDSFTTTLFFGTSCRFDNSVLSYISIGKEYVPFSIFNDYPIFKFDSKVGLNNFKAVGRVYEPRTDSTYLTNQSFNYLVREKFISLYHKGQLAFYKGIEDTVSIRILESSIAVIQKVRISGKDNRIVKINNTTYNVIAFNNGKIYANYKNGVSDSFAFNVKPIVFPAVVIGQMRSENIISVDEIRIIQKLNLLYQEDYFKNSCQIKSFDCIRLRRTEDEIIVQNKTGESFDINTLNLLDQVQSGDIIIFENIQLKCFFNKQNIFGNSITLHIK